MGLWVVNDTICRSRMRDVPGPSAVRRAWIRGRFGLSGECRQKEAVGSGSGTGWEGSRAGVRPLGIDRMTARAIGAVPGRASRGG